MVQYVPSLPFLPLSPHSSPLGIAAKKEAEREFKKKRVNSLLPPSEFDEVVPAKLRSPTLPPPRKVKIPKKSLASIPLPKFLTQTTEEEEEEPAPALPLPPVARPITKPRPTVTKQKVNPTVVRPAMKAARTQGVRTLTVPQSPFFHTRMYVSSLLLSSTTCIHPICIFIQASNKTRTRSQTSTQHPQTGQQNRTATK